MKRPRLSLSIGLLLSLIASPAWAASLTHGPLVGGVTPTTAVVFLRTDVAVQTGYVRALCCSIPFDTPFSTSDTEDNTARVTLGGLIPALSYTVQVFLCTNPQDPDECALQAQTSTFRTFPAPDTTQPFTFVVLTDFALGPSGTSGNGGPGFDECPDLSTTTFKKADAETPRLRPPGRGLRPPESSIVLRRDKAARREPSMFDLSAVPAAL